MTAQIIPFNPLDKKNLGASVAEALLAGPAYPLNALPVFGGAGIYAIYYDGPFPAYAEISRRNANGKWTAPIYVGKAIYPGARKGGDSGANASGRPLRARLQQHADSIRATTNLDIADFHCRFLVVDDIWIPLGESLVIARYSPAWNAIIDGFGNHDPGSGRYGGVRPRWDVLHPGRAWAERCKNRDETPDQIAREVETYLAALTFPISDRFIGLDD